jgi:hypothetical protein
MLNELESHIYPFKKLTSKIYNGAGGRIERLIISPSIIIFALLSVIDWALVLPIRLYIVLLDRFKASNRNKWLILPLVLLFSISLFTIVWMTPIVVYDTIMEKRNRGQTTDSLTVNVNLNTTIKIKHHSYMEPSDEGGDMVRGRVLKHKLCDDNMSVHTNDVDYRARIDFE